MTFEPASPFWSFSLAVYGRPGVKEACLELQEAAKADVNVLLYALWLGTRGRRLAPADMAGVAAFVERWRGGVVIPLRAARRALKNPPAGFAGAEAAALREAVSRAELEAERLQQMALYNFAPVEKAGLAGEPEAAARANVAAYEGALGAVFSTRSVLTLVAGALSAATQIKEEA